MQRAALSWIRDFTPVDAPVDELVDALNQLGLEVEGVEEPGREVRGVRVARILDVLPHPDADRLQLADVDFGDGTTRGRVRRPEHRRRDARAVRRQRGVAAGRLHPRAPQDPGQVSDGMLCSAKELGLGDDHAGILDLDATAELGTDVREVLGLDDVVFDLAITPNRPDAMCIVGVARGARGALPAAVHGPRTGRASATRRSATGSR